MTRIKICGFTNADDCLNAAALGADALGFVFAESKRQVSPEQVKEITADLTDEIIQVGIFVDEPISSLEAVITKAGLTEVQLYLSDFTKAEPIIESLAALSVPYLLSHRVKNADVLNEIKEAGRSAFHLDAYHPKLTGGTGRSFDWKIAANASKLGELHLAGGLTPANINDALNQVKPFGVDLSSGVEDKRGRKDYLLMKEFIRKVREWDSLTD